MGDSMDEELHRGGMAMAHASGPHAFSDGTGPLGYARPQQCVVAPVPAGVGAGAPVAVHHHALQQQQHQHQQGVEEWTRKRGRGDERDFVPLDATALSLGRESPDSEMSSSSGSGGGSSDGSINRGIKRMRLDHQHQFGHQQHQHQEQGQHSLAAFSSNSATAAVAVAAAAAAATGPRVVLHHPSPLVRAASDNHGAPPPSLNSTIPNHARVARSASGGTLQIGGTPGGGEGNLPGQQQRSSSLDCCLSFPPFKPQPPSQARYVRGIRVEVGAPSDVDYSNVNNTLRQLHMERRMMAAGRGEAGGRGAGGAAPPGAGDGRGSGWVAGGGHSR